MCIHGGLELLEFRPVAFMEPVLPLLIFITFKDASGTILQEPDRLLVSFR